MKAKELAELLLTVPEWDVYVEEDGWGASPAIVSNMNLIDPRCKHGHVTLCAGPTTDPMPEPSDNPEDEGYRFDQMPVEEAEEGGEL